MSVNVNLMSPATTPGGNNTYVPNSAATWDMLQGYSKNINSFAVNRVAQRFPVDKANFLYAQWQSVQETRLLGSSAATYGNLYRWPIGQPAASGITNIEQFNFAPAYCERFNFPTVLPLESVEQSAFQVTAAHLGMLGSELMRQRTYSTWYTFQNSSITSASATSLGGGFWSVGTPTNPYCRTGLNAVGVAINQQTANSVTPDKLCVVTNPNTSTKISVAQELTDYLKFLVGYQAFQGTGEIMPGRRFAMDGVYFGGFEFVVDDAGYSTTQQNISPNVMQYCVPDDQAFILSRASGLEGVAGSVSWSTIMHYFYEEMTIEQYYSPNDRLYYVRAITNWVPIISNQGAKAAYIVTAVYS